MRLTHYFIPLILSFSFSNCFSQFSGLEHEKFNAAIDKAVKTTFFPDSTALYTGQIHINLDKKTNYVPLIKSTDTTLTNRLCIMEMLSKYNYKPLLMGLPEVRLVIPIAITIAGSRDRRHAKISTDSLSKQISYFFYSSPANLQSKRVEYMRPIISTIDNF